MPYYKITANKRGELVAKVQVLTKDTATGKNKLVVKRIYNTEKLTDAKFRKQVEKFSLTFEDEIKNAYADRVAQIKNNVLTFSQLANEFLTNIELHLSQNYYDRAIKTVECFNNYLKEQQLYTVPISEIRVRDVQLFLNSFKTYGTNKNTVRLVKPLPAKVNFRELDREHILNRNMSYNMCHKKCHILKDKAVQICSLYQLDLAEFFEDVINIKQYAVETVKGHRRILRAIFNEAVRYEWIIKNPVSATKIGAGNNNTSLKAITEKEVLTVSEMQQFIQALKKLGEDKINRKVVLETMLLTGVRKAEMAGLRWSDVDFNNRVIHIKRNKLYSLKKGTYEKAPKTESSVRDIPLPDILITDLKAYYEWFKIADENFDNKLDQYYLSSTIYRQPADANAPYTWLKKFLFDNGFKHRGCHSLRHTYCSILLSQNVPIQTVSKYMGHSDSSVTLQVYSHFIPDTQEKVLNVLNSIV